MTFSNKTYDILKWIAQILLPALAALYFALSEVWALPYSKEVVGTITAIDAFIGVILGLSSATYYKTTSNTIKALEAALMPNKISYDIQEVEEFPKPIDRRIKHPFEKSIKK